MNQLGHPFSSQMTEAQFNCVWASFEKDLIDAQQIQSLRVNKINVQYKYTPQQLYGEDIVMISSFPNQ